MNYEIIELEEFSGSKATIYSVLPIGDDFTLFDYFIEAYQKEYSQEIGFIINRLEVMVQMTGAREIFFKTQEGLPGDGVCALYDNPGRKLRLYCIRYGNVAVILGGGAVKAPGVRAWQDDEKLKEAAETMIQVARDVYRRIREGSIQWMADGLKLSGNLIFTNDDENE